MEKFLNKLKNWVVFLYVVLFAVLSNVALGVSQGKVVVEPVRTEAEEYSRDSRFDIVPEVQAAEISNISESEEFILKIDKIGLEHNIISNVDPADKAEYLDVLNTNIAHGLYTRLPDQATHNGNVYLFAHRNGTYEGKSMAFFHDLDQLQVGDRATIYYHGESYVYSLTSSRVVDDSDVGVYTGDSLSPTLTLQTCENGFEDRLIVVFELISVI